MLPKDNQRLYWRLLDYLQWTCLNIFLKKSAHFSFQTLFENVNGGLQCCTQTPNHEHHNLLSYRLLLPKYSWCFMYCYFSFAPALSLFHIPGKGTYLKIFLPTSLPLSVFFFLSLSIAVSFWNGMWPILSTQTNRPLAEQEILHRIYCISGSRFSSFHISPLSFSRL